MAEKSYIEKRSGELKERIVSALNAVSIGRKKLEGKNLVEALHKEVGGSEYVAFSSVMRVLHRFLKKELRRPIPGLRNPGFELTKKVYLSSDRWDRIEFHDRRKKEE